MNKSVRTYIGKRQYSYIYILHKLFNGDIKEFCRAIRIHETYPADIAKWDAEYGKKVKEDIEEDYRMATQLRDADGDIPTVASIKDNILVKIKMLINSTEDPAKLATCYRVLSEFGKDSKRSASAKDAAQVVMERIKPKNQKQMERNEVEREYARIHGNQNEEEEF